MTTIDELRARLAGVSVDDLDAVHDLWLDQQKMLKGKLGMRSSMPFVEVSRRIERAMGQAIRRGQARGDVSTQKQGNVVISGQRTVKGLVGGPSMASPMFKLADDVSDEAFEDALLHCMKEGLPTQKALIARLGKNQLAGRRSPVVVTKVIPTRRGRRTVEHMAMSINAIAMGVADIDPGEVDVVAMRSVIDQIFEDIGVVRTFLRKVNKNAQQ